MDNPSTREVEVGVSRLATSKLETRMACETLSQKKTESRVDQVVKAQFAA